MIMTIFMMIILIFELLKHPFARPFEIALLIQIVLLLIAMRKPAWWLWGMLFLSEAVGATLSVVLLLDAVEKDNLGEFFICIGAVVGFQIMLFLTFVARLLGTKSSQ